MKSKTIFKSVILILIYLTNLTNLTYQLNNECSTNKNLIKFNSSLNYFYSYEIETFAKIRPNDNLKPSSLKFRSEIKINKLTDCDFQLKFDKLDYDIESNLRSYSLDYLNQILSRPFNFKFIDGEIKYFEFQDLKDDKLNKWIRKLYENLFTTLQLPLNDDIEQDEEIHLTNKETFDNCTIDYRIKDRRRSYFEIKSTKIYKNCLKNKLMDKFLINSEHECNHFVKDNQLIEVNCFENNKANVLNVVQLINTKLKFLKTESHDQKNDKKQDLTISALIQDNNSNQTELNLLEISKNLLTNICDRLKTQIDPKITEFVIELSRNIRKLDYNQLIQLTDYSNEIECKDRQQFKDILNSIIFQQGNSASIQYLLKHIDKPMETFYSLLAFSHQPTENAIKLIIPKLNEQLNKIDTTYQPVLGITSFIGNFCGDRNCEHNELVIETQKMLINKLGRKCSNRKHQILILKCIQNIGLLDQLIDQIIPCLEQNNKFIRLTAIQLLEKTSNNDAINRLKSIFSNQNEDNSLRINAFLILIKSLKSNQIKDYLINQLKIEQNVQILSFINSYLKNMKSNDELYEASRELVNLINQQKSTENIFLFSKNIHLSTSFLKTNQLNGELNINLIRNNNNQLMNGNLKGEIALTEQEDRQSIEIGFIQNNLNSLVNRFMNELVKKSVNLQGTFQQMLNLIITMKKDKESIENLLNEINNNKEGPIELTSYINLNGKTIFLVDYSDIDQTRTNQKIKRSLNLDTKSLLNQDYERAFVFIYLNKGYELANPLSAIKFELTGVSVIGLKFNNQTLAPTFINDISASIEIGDKQEHKLKFYSGLNLNSIFNYKIQPVDGDYILNIELSNDTIPLIKSTTYIGEHSLQDKLIKETSGKSICTSKLSDLLGIEFCLKESKNLDNPIQKLILYDIYIQKTDQLINNWQTIFKIEKQQSINDNQYNIVILFDTPGSSINRHFNSKINFKNANKNIQINGTFSNQIQKYAINLNINLNDLNNLDSRLYFYLNDELLSIIDYIQTIKHFKTKSEYRPSLRLFMTPNLNKPFIHLTGSLVIDLINRNNLQFGLYSKTTNIQYLKGLITRSNEKYLIDILFNLPSTINVRLISNFQYQNQQFLSTETKIDYNLFKHNLQDTIKISTKFRNTSFNTLIGFSNFISLRCLKNSNFNFDLAYNLTYKANTFLENDFKFKYLNIKEFNLFQQYTFTNSKINIRSFSCNNFLKINFQPQSLTYQSQIGLIYNPAEELFKYKIDFNLDKILNQLAIDLIKFNFDYEQISKKPLKTYLRTSLQFKNQFDLSYKDELEEIGKNEFKGQTLLKWSKNKFINLDYQYLIRNDIIGRLYKINVDFQTHTMNDPYNHQILFEYQKTNLTLKSLFKLKDKNIWNLNLFSEHFKQFNLTLESDYLNIRNDIKFNSSNVIGYLEMDANNYFKHNSFLNFTSKEQFQFNSLTVNQMRINDQILANLTINQQPTQLKLNLNSYLVSNVKLNYNKHDQMNSGQFEIQDTRLQHKSTWTMNENLHLKMKFLRQNNTIGNLVLLTENYFNECDMKGTFLNWNLNGNLKFKNEGRKLIIVRLNEIVNDKLIVDHNTNISVAVTNGFIKSSTMNNGIQIIDFDAKILGRDSSKIILYIKDLFQFDLIFNPFIKNKFADLEIKDLLLNENKNESRKYLNAKFRYDPRSFELNTNYFNRKLIYFKTTEKSIINLDFDDLKFLGRCNHEIILNRQFIQYGLKQFNLINQKSNLIDNLDKQLNFKYFNKKKFSLNLDYYDQFRLDSDLNFYDNRSIYLNLKKQSDQLELKIDLYNYLLVNYLDELNLKQIKLLIDLNNDEYRLLNLVHKNELLNYKHETLIYLYRNYNLNAKIETINKLLFELNYKLWESFYLNYKKPEKEFKINLIKNQLYFSEFKEIDNLYKIELSSDYKTINLFIRNLEFKHESQLQLNHPNKLYLIKLLTNHHLLKSKNEKIFNCELLISKQAESQLNLDYYHHNFEIKIDLFLNKKIQSTYIDKNQNLKSLTEFAYLGPQTYQLYSNVTIDNRMPFKLSMYSSRKKPTQFNLVKDNLILNGEFNFFKLNKQTGLIRIRDDVDKLYGNITLEANKKSFLIANYILKDNYGWIKSKANLTLAMISSEILKFNYKDDNRIILTRLLWLGDRIILNSEINHTDYTHKLIGFLSYDPSKTVKLNLNKTFNLDKTFDCNLIASLTKPSYLKVEQLNFGNLNVSIDLINKLDQKMNLTYSNDDQSADFNFLNQNSKINSKLSIKLEKLHPILLIDSSFNLINRKSIYDLNILDANYRTNLNSDFNIMNDSLIFNLNTLSKIKFIPKIRSNLILIGLSTKLYELNTNWLINSIKLNSNYKHRKELNLEFNKLDYYYQVLIKKELNLIESFIKRSINNRSSILNFNLNNSDNYLNTQIGLEHLNRKTIFEFKKQIDTIKQDLIFEIIFDDQLKNRKIYDLKIQNINDEQLNRKTITLNNPNLKVPILIDYRKDRNNLLIEWNLMENNLKNNQLKINFDNLQFTEFNKLIKAIISFNNNEILGIDLEKNSIRNDLTKLYLNFFNSTINLVDTNERLIFNINENDLNLKVDKEYLIHLESKFKINKLNQKIIIYYDVKKKAISYQDFDLESFRTLSSQLFIKPIPLSSIYISIFKTKDEIINEIFLLNINSTNSNKRKLILKYDNIYLFSRQFIKRQKKLVNDYWDQFIVKTNNQKLSLKNYLIDNLFNSFYLYGYHLREELTKSLNPIINDWPIIDEFIEYLIQDYVRIFLIKFNNLIEIILNRLKDKYNLIIDDIDLFKEYTIEFFNVFYETFEYKFIKLRKYLFKKFNLIKSFFDRQINLIKIYVPENYWNLIINLWNILLSTEFWQSKFPVLKSNFISFYF